jgi:hypothetical protein
MLFRNQSTNDVELVASDLADGLALVDLRSLHVRLRVHQYVLARVRVRVRLRIPNYRHLASWSTKAIHWDDQWSNQYGGDLESLRWDCNERWFVYRTILGGDLHRDCYQRS